MAKDKKAKSSPALTEEQRRFRRQFVLNTSVILFLFIALAVGFSSVKSYVDHKLTFPTAIPKVVLKNRPAWMSDFLAQQICAQVAPTAPGSAFDQNVLSRSYMILEINPWIKKINQVRRVYGQKPGDTLEIDCEFRAPVAMVRYLDSYALIDADGVQLPEIFNYTQAMRAMFGPDGKVNIRIIEGVTSAPPETGRKWRGDDLFAGLEMVNVLYGKPYTEQLQRINVSNYKGRVNPLEAWIVLLTPDNTEIRWGRPPKAEDAFAEVPVSQKLDYLEKIVAKYHRVDAGHSAIEIRFEGVRYPVGDHPTGERSAGLKQEP